MSHCLITCILPKDRGLALIDRLHVAWGIDAANVTTGRGLSQGSVETISYGEWAEMDLLEVVVERAEADAVFAYLYEEGEIGRPHGGIVYMAALGPHTPFMLPEIRDEAAG